MISVSLATIAVVFLSQNFSAVVQKPLEETRAEVPQAVIKNVSEQRHEAPKPIIEQAPNQPNQKPVNPPPKIEQPLPRLNSSKIQQKPSVAKQQQQIAEQLEISDTVRVQSKLNLELHIHSLINDIRLQHDLRPLEWDGRLAQIAANYSEDMAARNFYSHVNPEGLTFADRYKKFGYNCYIQTGDISYTTGGENAMFMQGITAEIPQHAVDGWMNSPSHRDAILEPFWLHEVIGIAYKGSKIYITQNFC